MRIISRALLIIECLILLIPSFLGYILGMAGLLELSSGETILAQASGFMAGLVILTTLTALWRVMFWVIVGGPGRGANINRFWIIACYIGALLTCVSWIFFMFTDMEEFVSSESGSFVLFGYGILFIFTFIHTMMEKHWQESAYNRNHLFQD